MTPLKSPGSSLWRLRGDPYDRAREAEIPLPNTATAKRDLDGQVQLSDEQRRLTAQAIIKAAAKARGEPIVAADDPSLPTDPIARQIILCGRRRRGEQV
jgi:hypothetical protein